MELIPRRKLELMSGRSNRPLAEQIASHLGVELGEPNLREFANGEIHCRYDSSIRGSDVFIIQTHCGPVNDSLMEPLIMIDAAKRASAKRIPAVCPYYGYSRQDRKSTGREPITAKLVADMLQAAGADRVMSVDLHSGQIQGFFDVPFDHLTAAPVLEAFLRDQATSDLVVVTPDAGRVKVAERYAQRRGREPLRRRGPPRRGRRAGHLGACHPPRALGPGKRPPQGLADHAGDRDRHPARAPRAPLRRARGAVRRPAAG